MGICRAELLSLAADCPKSVGLARFLAGASGQLKFREKSSRRVEVTVFSNSRDCIVAADPGSGHWLESEIPKCRLRNATRNFPQSRRLFPAARAHLLADTVAGVRPANQSASLESRCADVELLLSPGAR